MAGGKKKKLKKEKKVLVFDENSRRFVFFFIDFAKFLLYLALNYQNVLDYEIFKPQKDEQYEEYANQSSFPSDLKMRQISSKFNAGCDAITAFHITPEISKTKNLRKVLLLFSYSKGILLTKYEEIRSFSFDRNFSVSRS